MGARDRWLGRAFSRTLLLLFVALVAAVAGAIPGDPAGAAKKTPPGDPPGNNGTVKVEQGDETNGDLGNEPHGEDCRIWLEFYGFDEGQTADITFNAHAPTKAKDDKPLVSDKGVTISGDAAGGGPNDPDLVSREYGYDLSAALAGIEPHPKQGYHIKLSIENVKNKDGSDVPGGGKHKVFWLAPCVEDAAPPSTLRISKALEGTGQGPFAFELLCDHRPLNRTFTLQAGEKLDITDVPPGTTCAVTETDKKNAESTAVTEDPPHGKSDDGEVKTNAGKATIVKFTNKFPGAGSTPAPSDNDLRPAGSGGNPGTSVGGTNTATNPGASVLGATETAPEAAATLPRTGNNPRPLTVTGLSALAAGAALLAGGRRRRV
jgi:LPXTG-motif cell wall-anchored protein